MLPTHRETLGAHLPDALSYPTFADRDAAWLLYQRMGGTQRIGDLGRGPLAPYMKRPAIRAVTARCGDGRLSPDDLLPLADPLAAFEPDAPFAATAPAEAACTAMMEADMRWFTVSFATWPQHQSSDWRDLQISRQGCNLVLQVNFPDAHQQRFFRIFNQEARHAIEYAGHPIRRDGPITMAWARLDFERDGEDVLIEELQSDWLRVLRNGKGAVQGLVDKKSRALAKRYVEETLALYSDWARVTLLAALAFSVAELGMRRIWLHQPGPGARLKHIRDELPPRSLYTDLPRRFGFRPTDRAPAFLYDARHHVLGRLRRRGIPLFWRLDLEDTAHRPTMMQNIA
ncbi:MAG: hypothetical protein AAGB15_01665 [Pseudomonadota bacterium]